MAPVGGQTVLVSQVPTIRVLTTNTSIPSVPINLNAPVMDPGVNQMQNIIVSDAPIINPVRMTPRVSNNQNLPLGNSAFITPITTTKVAPNVTGDLSPIMMSPLVEDPKFAVNSNNNFPAPTIPENNMTGSIPFTSIKPTSGPLLNGNLINGIKNIPAGVSSMNPMDKVNLSY